MRFKSYEQFLQLTTTGLNDAQQTLVQQKGFYQGLTIQFKEGAGVSSWKKGHYASSLPHTQVTEHPWIKGRAIKYSLKKANMSKRTDETYYLIFRLL